MNSVAKFLRVTLLPATFAAALAIAVFGSPSALGADQCRPDGTNNVCKSTESCVWAVFFKVCTTRSQYGELIGCPTCWNDGETNPAGPTDPTIR